MDAATIVRRIRASNGITRGTLARLADLSPSTVGRIESGKLDPTWTTLQKLLDATGMTLRRSIPVSAGDPTAIQSARVILEGEPDRALPRWQDAWERAGWVPSRTPEDVLALSVLAGNAGEFARRASRPLWVTLPGQRQWQDLPRALADAGVEYAISGLVATRPDRATSTAMAPIVYTATPEAVVRQFDLVETRPLRGVMLAQAVSNEMEGSTMDGGLTFVSRAQAMLDAFASGGRQPDKADAVALSWPITKVAA